MINSFRELLVYQKALEQARRILEIANCGLVSVSSLLLAATCRLVL
jgi:hypothetical protein